jgi:hypothetical protein
VTTRLREKELAPQSAQLSVSSFIQFHQGFTFQEMAEKIYQNKQRTSTCNGILKAEAAYLFAGVVQRYGVEYLQDVNKILGNENFEAEIARIPGQGSGDSGKGKAFDPLACNRFPNAKIILNSPILQQIFIKTP